MSSNKSQTTNYKPQTTNREELIPNRVASSGLITLSLEDFYPRGKRMQLDIADWLYERMILREKDFRAKVKEHNWDQYQNAYVAVYCSEEAIIPQWAYMLLGVSLEPYAKKVVYGSLELLENIVMEEAFNEADLEQYQDQRLIIKGCGDLPIPAQAFLSLSARLKPLAKSIMYGEACSTVPIYKRR